MSKFAMIFRVLMLIGNCSFCIDLLMVALQFSLWPNPLEMLRQDIFQSPIDMNGKMSVFLVEPKVETIFEVKESSHDLSPLIVIHRL